MGLWGSLAPQSPATPVDDSSDSYTLAPGDNPAAVAKRLGVPLDQIMSLNQLTPQSARRLQVGQQLKLPGQQTPDQQPQTPAGNVTFDPSSTPSWMMRDQNFGAQPMLASVPAAVQQPSSPSPTPTVRPQEPSTLTKALMTAHSYLDPTQYFGGDLNTALAGIPAGRIVAAVRSAMTARPLAAELTGDQAGFLSKQLKNVYRRGGMTELGNIDPNFIDWRMGNIPKPVTAPVPEAPAIPDMTPEQTQFIQKTMRKLSKKGELGNVDPGFLDYARRAGSPYYPEAMAKSLAPPSGDY